MNRKYSDEELRRFFNAEYDEETMSKMAQEIVKDPRSEAYLAGLWEQKLGGDPPSKGDYKAWAEKYGLADRIRKITDNIRKRKELPPPSDYGFGQIFETSLPLNWPQPRQERRLVMVMTNDDDSYNETLPDVLAAPISFRVDQACDTDVMIDEKDSTLGMSYLIRIGSMQPIFTDQLDRYFGTIPEHYDELIRDVWSYMAGLPEGRANPGFTKIAGAEDRRYYFETEENKITAYMREPVEQMIAVSEELPDVMTTDISHIVDLGKLEKEIETESVPVFRLAASAVEKPDILEQRLSGIRAFILHDDPAFFIELLVNNEALALQVVTTKAGAIVDSRILDEDGVLWEKSIRTEDNHIGQAFLPGISAFINKILTVELNYELYSVTKKIRLHHAYFRQKN
ncbi:MAG: hypothetical protein AB7W47_17210 [Calditrichaceae bacterium]